MDTAHWPQFPGGGVVVKQMEAGGGGGGGGGGSSTSNKGHLLERKGRPQKDQALNCPRCNSTNTKFCYYNNYSLSQPRYFCKACRRYWTEGGSLRNVPVGGGSRKNKRSSLSSSSSSSVADHKKINGSDHHHPHQNPKIHHAQDLNLAINPNPNPNPNPSSAMELLKSGMGSRGLASFMAVANGGSAMYNGGGFGLHELKPTSLSFSLEGFESSGYGDLHHHHQHQHHHHQGGQDQDQTAAMFPMEDLKQSNGTPTTTPEFEHSRVGGGGHGGDSSAGYWNGMLGGGSW